MPGDSKEIHSTQRQPTSREAKGDERRVIGADAAAWARGCQSCLPNWGVVSSNSGCTSQPHITKSLQNMSRQVGEHGNVCPCACVRPVMQMTLQASARDPIRQCGLRHGTLGSASRGGLAFSACSFCGDRLCFVVQSHHHTTHFRDVSCSPWAQKTTKPSLCHTEVTDSLPRDKEMILDHLPSSHEHTCALPTGGEAKPCVIDKRFWNSQLCI